jgi:formylglycine-generating enzyme required for sulfatase activity
VILLLLIVCGVAGIWIKSRERGANDTGRQAANRKPGNGDQVDGTAPQRAPVVPNLGEKRPDVKKPDGRPPIPPPGPVKPGAGQRFRNPIGMDMVPISADSFQMGSADGDGAKDETPRHPVRIGRPFFLAAHKTTQAQFQEVMGRNPSWFSATGGGKDKVNGDTGRFPVEEVTYFDALEFCNKLSENEGRRPCYRLTAIQREDDKSIKAANVEVLEDGTGYRLPSEAEWEFCARAGTMTRYSFGDDAAQLGEYAWFDDNSGGCTHPVGQKKPNRWELYDMGGLLWEWCDDVWHDNYEGAPADGSAWRNGGDQSRRVVRGGSWFNHARSCRCANRFWFEPGDRNYILGFRVVLVSP